MKHDKYTLLEITPDIDGLDFRGFQGESDFPAMIKIIEAASESDHEERSITLLDIKNDYAHLTNCDPAEDMIIAEIHGTPIAYSRVDWYQEENPNDRIYAHFVYIHPDRREKGVETAMITWCESRLKTIASQHPHDSNRFLQTYSSDRKPRFNQLLESMGYQRTRYFFEMSRPLEDIPEAELPKDVEVRPVMKADIRKIWDASIEAFRDHWGFAEPKEEDFIGYQESKYFQPDLWQVAWHGDQVVGSVMNYIDHDYNGKYHKKRGWTEEITTHRDWRRKGIAGALIVRSMHMHKNLGMTEVALGVDTSNLTGAHKLYSRLGYQQDKTMITYRKPIQTPENR
jgi:GNAT superfamily N-acetyltransferase